MKTKSKRPNPAGYPRKIYPPSFRLRAVKLYLEEDYSAEMLAEELGIGTSTLSGWVARYRKNGEAGLENRTPAPRGRVQANPAAKKKAIELKKQDPKAGSRRISQVLRRCFFLKASPETVRKTLKEEGLIEKPRKKPKKNPAKPRFFERARPNQMWQSDIFSFRLGGRAAYLIGYVDDYSRYLVGLGLFRSQTAEHVIEVYRRALGEYGPPKEMLTDNGRQYVNWRGTTRFEKDLKKERIKHIRSQPHHPMTLGKIERFWKTIYTEFLSRVQFESFEEAEARLALWVKYYNHKRPHQGIGGLCPADRFFEIQSALREAVERGVEENVLEAALRGRPRKPFYMVGRMGEQSVVIRAEKGKVKMLLDGEENQEEQELIYDVNESEIPEEYNQTSVLDAGAETQKPEIPPETASGGHPGGEPEAPGKQAHPEESELVNEVTSRVALLPEEEVRILLDLLKQSSRQGGEPDEGVQSAAAGEEESGADPQGSVGRADGQRGGRTDGGQPKDLLQVGEAWPGGDAGGAERTGGGPAPDRTQPRDRSPQGTGGTPGNGASAPGAL